MKEHDNENSGKKVVIIGGGPAGLTASYHLSKKNVKSTVLEKDQIVGGLARTVNYKDYYFDIGGHRFFTKSDEVEEIWKAVLGNDFLECKRLSRIYYNKKFYYYPLRALNAMFGLGIWNSFLILLSYLYAQLNLRKQNDTFEQWVSNRFGKRLFKIFFKAYTEKVWGMPCNEIRAEWAAKRIKDLSLLVAVKNVFIKANNNIKNKKDAIKSLINEFHYPKLGPGMMWRTIADIIENKGSKLMLGAEVVGIRWRNNQVTDLEVRQDGEVKLIPGTDFISSMPMKEAIQKFKPNVPQKVLDAANVLKYRDFLTVALIVNKRDIFQDNWIYIHDPEVKVGRIQNFKNWSRHMVPDIDKTCLGLEYFCFEGDALWNLPDDQLIELGTRELEMLGFVSSSDVEDGKVVRMSKSYPIYDSTYQGSVEIIREFLEGINNFQLVGRNGLHKYNNQDHSMLTAMRAAENILGANHDIWQVSEDQEYLEEIGISFTKKDAFINFLSSSLAKIDKLGFATALGSVFGLIIFFATIFLVIKGGPVVGPNMNLLDQYFFGYTVTIKGAFIGLAYSFSWGFLFGWLFAYLRNLFIAGIIYRAKRKSELLKFKDFIDHF